MLFYIRVKFQRFFPACDKKFSYLARRSSIQLNEQVSWNWFSSVYLFGDFLFENAAQAFSDFLNGFYSFT